MSDLLRYFDLVAGLEEAADVSSGDWLDQAKVLLDFLTDALPEDVSGDLLWIREGLAWSVRREALPARVYGNYRYDHLPSSVEVHYSGEFPETIQAVRALGKALVLAREEVG